MDFIYIKALHVIFVVTWFSGMFYLCRLFIYNTEAEEKPAPERRILQDQFNIMIRRLLFGITWPSAILTLFFGIWLVIIYPSIPVWLWIKMFLVLLLFIYQFTLHILYRQQKKGLYRYSGNLLRFWNEVPTVFLVAIVMLAVVKENISLLYGIIGLVGLTLLLLAGIKVYKYFRNKEESRKADAGNS